MSGRLGWREAGWQSAGFGILFWFLWFAASPAVCSQTNPEPTDWVVDSWPAEAGLPFNSITCLRQTRDGYLWIGTLNGLARFDGVRFTNFRVADGVGLKSNRIRCLFEDASGILWIGTDEGGLAYEQQGRFITFTTPDGLSSDSVLCVGEDRGGALWVGTDSGLNRRRDGRITTFFKTDGLPDDRVNALSPRGDAAMLFATGRGLCEFRGDMLVPVAAALQKLGRTHFNDLRVDGQGAIWFAGGEGLVRAKLRAGAESASVMVKHTSAVAVVLGHAGGGVWFGTETGEVGRFRNESAPAEIVWRAPRGITSLCEDQEGNLWVGTAGEGLFRLKPRQLRLFAVPNFQGGNWASSLYESPAGELRLAARDNGIYRAQAGRFVIEERVALPDGVEAHTVCQSAAGDLWVGTLRDGLFRCEPGNGRQFSERDGLSDSAIEAMCVTAAGGLWIGTRNGGLNHFDGHRFTRFNTPWGFAGAFAAALETDVDGGLWIGTSGDGLFEFRAGRFTAYTRESGLPSGAVHALEADPDGTVWVGTARGLCRVKSGTVTPLNLGGLGEEAVYQMRSDESGALWLGASSRILRVNKLQLAAFAEGRTNFFSVVPYGREDGVAGVQCLPRIQSRGPRFRPGLVWFATTKGLLVVDRAGAAANAERPKVALEYVFVENQSVAFGDRLVVSPGKESLRFDFTALSLTAPGKVNFRYQLEGLDRELSEASGARSVRYPKVPAGHYRFRVIASNHEGIWNETGATLAVVVRPFWWATNGFRAALLLTVTAGVVGVYRLRQARRREIERLRLRIASDLHDDLGSSLWSITLLSRMLAKHGNLGEEARQDVGEINRIALQSSNSIRDIIWLINPAFDSLQDLLLRTKDFAATVLRGVEYRMTSEIPDLSRKLPFDFRHNLFLFFKEALTNTARHSRATVAEVKFVTQGNYWRLTISDNGRGFDPDAVTDGNGLRNLRTRAERMGAMLDLRTAPGQGVVLVLTIPPP